MPASSIQKSIRLSKIYRTSLKWKMVSMNWNGSRLYVKRCQYLWQGKERSAIETHKKYIDIQNASVRCGENRLETGM